MKRPEGVIPLMLEFEAAHLVYKHAKQLFYFTTWYSKETELDFYEKRSRLIEAEQSLYRVIYPE
jgi:hypothetical protein